jgi:hypothetical protein
MPLGVDPRASSLRSNAAGEVLVVPPPILYSSANCRVRHGYVCPGGQLADHGPRPSLLSAAPRNDRGKEMLRSA